MGISLSPMSFFTNQTAVLEALISGEAYGLELLDRVEERSKGAISLTNGSLYRALRALQDEGFVKQRKGEPRREGGRPRIYYTLTAEGSKAAMTNRETAGLFFGHLGSVW